MLVVLLLKQLPIELGGNYSTMLAGRVRDGAQKRRRADRITETNDAKKILQGKPPQMNTEEVI